MSNVQFETKGTKLVITIDISPATIASAPPSKTGKTRLVATTGGGVPVGGNMTLALNLMTVKV